MNVRRTGSTFIHHHKINGRQYVQLERESLGSGAIVWGFLCAAAWMLVTVICMCL